MRFEGIRTLVNFPTQRKRPSAEYVLAAIPVGEAWEPEPSEGSRHQSEGGARSVLGEVEAVVVGVRAIGWNCA